MSLRPFRLPADLPLMAKLLPAAFQYPENPEWSLQTDELEGALRMVNTARRMWPLFALLQKISPETRDVLHGCVWEEDGHPVGMVNISREGSSDDWVIANVGVLPAYRRRGIARKVVEAAVELAREHDGKYVLLDVIAGNTPAYALYASMGFEHFISSVHLRHATPASIASCQPPAGYTASRLSPQNWRLHYELAQRITPASVQNYRPVTVHQFRTPASVRLFMGMLNTFSGVQERGLLVRAEADQQIVATLRLTAYRGSGGMNTCTIQLDPAHDALAPYLIQKMLHTFEQVSPKNRIAIGIPAWEAALIEAAESSGFTRVTEYHSMGMKL